LTGLRITAGTLRGRRIAVPPQDVRPTSERARQAFFNIVGPRITGAHFFDLFAGSGIFSFEAVSRGAAEATAIDLSRKNVAAIERLAREWDVPVKAIVGDVLHGVPGAPCPVPGKVNLGTGNWELDTRNPGTGHRAPGTRHDIVYADPPYDFARYDDLLTVLDGLSLAPDALVAVEHRRKTELASETKHLRLLRRAEYGEVWISMYGA